MPDIIRNPDDPDHFMTIEPLDGSLRVTRGGMMLAESRDVLRVVEHNGDRTADPVFYIRRTDLTLPLGRVDDKVTHCPIKGDATYYEIGSDIVAWSYETPYEFASALKGRMAFFPDQVDFETLG